MENKVTKPRVTQWNMAQVLLGHVPEAAPLVAREAAEAINISSDLKRLPAPPAPGELTGLSVEEQLSHPYFKATEAMVGSNMITQFGPYSVAGTMFLPVFEEALAAQFLNEDLVKRCCAFLEVVLSGEEYAAEGVVMMVAENFGPDLSHRVLPYAGPLFTDELRRCGWLG
jgi:hypothetical protein